jgi:hypothetical protein
MSSTFTSLKDILIRSKSTSPLGRVIEASMVCAIFKKALSIVFEKVCKDPESLILHITFQKYSLVVKAVHAAARNELFLRQYEILKYVNTELGGEIVKEIVIR